MKNILNKIDDILESNNSLRKFAVFDFDNTCIINDIGEATLHYLCENKLLKNELLLPKYQDINECHKAVFERYYNLLNSNQVQEAYEFTTKILAGYSIQEVNQLIEDMLEYEGKTIKERMLFGKKIAKGLKVKQNTKKLMDYLLNKNVEVWIVSASPKVIVEYAFQNLFPDYTCNLIGIETKINGNIFTDELVYPTPTFEGKVNCIKKYIDKKTKPIVGVGDSYNDLAMLKYSEIKVVVNKNNSLTKLARENNWYVI